jgi:hypothetical protein
VFMPDKPAAPKHQEMLSTFVMLMPVITIFMSCSVG